LLQGFGVGDEHVIALVDRRCCVLAGLGKGFAAVHAGAVSEGGASVVNVPAPAVGAEEFVAHGFSYR
jgi:hypothetical protein